MIKYDLLPEQLLYEGTISDENLFEPTILDEKNILNTHCAAYWQKLKSLQLSKSEIRRTGFPLSKQLVEREQIIMNGTLQAAKYALKYGVSFNIAGGTHHAFTNKGEGFCLLNDIAISANFLLDVDLAQQILVVDLDVHQGNGTAEIFENNSKVFTFSMHGAKNYPLKKEASDLDIGLPDGATDEVYLPILERELKKLIDKLEPDFIFFQSGVDVLKTDKLGRLSMSIAGCKQRDEMVLSAAYENEIPIALCMGGGYSPRIADIVEAHANTYRLAQSIFF